MKLPKLDFLHYFVHELKTPVTSLNLCMELLKNSKVSDQDKSELMQLVFLDIERLTFFINEVLDLRILQSNKDVISPCWSTWSKQVDKAKQSVDQLAKTKKITFSVNNAMPEDMEVLVDSLWMQNVLENLFTNAIKYSSPGSCIEVSSSCNNSNNLRVVVFNSGKPLSEEERNKVFKPFYSKHSKVQAGLKNTGLGLTIVKEVLEQHKSNFGFEKNDKGVSFFFEISDTRKKEQAA